MTTTERNRIDALRSQECGYKKISALTGVSVNTVKYYCRTHPLDTEPEDHCRHCGSVIEQTPHKRKRKFCSDECRIAWWSAHPEARTVKKTYSHVCAFCGSSFTSPRAGTRYCSSVCYANARRKTDA